MVERGGQVHYPLLPTTGIKDHQASQQQRRPCIFLARTRLLGILDDTSKGNHNHASKAECRCMTKGRDSVCQNVGATGRLILNPRTFLVLLHLCGPY